LQPTDSPKKPGQPADNAAPGFLRRIAAVFYDIFLLLAVLFVATAIALPLNAGKAFAYGQFFYPLYLFIVSFLFYGWFWTHGGQTLGLRSWKIKLISTTGKQITWQQAALRYLCALLSWLCLGMGFVWILIDKDHRAWHDILSKSRLVMTEKP
jgi:uncharacterized RDD family membrane protein YckC